MEYARKYLFGLICFILITVVLCISIFLIITKTVHLSIDCFAVDSTGKVYVDLSGNVEVYQDGQYLYTFDKESDFDNISSNGAIWTISEEDTIILCQDGKVYSFDLEGKLLHSYEDTIYSKRSQLLSQKKQVVRNGDIYKQKNVFGRTSIVKNETETIYQITLLSLIVKVALVVSVILFIPLIILGVIEGVRLKSDGF